MTDREMLFDLCTMWRMLINDETYENGAILDAFDRIVTATESDNVLTKAWHAMHDDESYTDDEVIEDFNDVVADLWKELNDEQ